MIFCILCIIFSVCVCSAQQVNDISRETFLDVGEGLQKRRHEDFIATFHNRQTILAK
jgi:hypothetical protein